MIKFDHNKLKKTTTSVDKPVLHINKIILITTDKEWASRLFGASLSVKFACIDKNKKETKTSLDHLSLGTLITPYHKQPVLELNQQFSFVDKFNFTKDDECTQWKTTIELNNLSLEKNESLEVSIIDSSHIQKRIKDWKKRVADLYKETKKWLGDVPQYNIKIGQPTPMYEELMQSFNIQPTETDTADIFKENKILISFKPKGLWMIGANGRIDIISQAGNYILVDIAEQFQEPQWHIYTATDRRTGKPFTKKELLNLISSFQ